MLELYFLFYRIPKMLTRLAREQIAASVSEKGPSLHRGTIAAGEMLIADGSLDTIRLNVDNEIRAGDQEDSGFVQACILSGIPWCVFRGISDYGNPDKDKTWQFVAALAAASAGHSFLRDCYKPRLRDPSSEQSL